MRENLNLLNCNWVSSPHSNLSTYFHCLQSAGKIYIWTNWKKNRHPQEPRKKPQTCQFLKCTPFFKLVRCMARPSHCLLNNVSMHPHIKSVVYRSQPVCWQSTGSCSWNYYLMGAPQHTLDRVESTLSCLGGSQLKTPWPVNQAWVENLDCCYVCKTEDKNTCEKTQSFHMVKRNCSFTGCSQTI